MSAFAILDTREIAAAMGGDVQGRAALVPGPGHSPRDRSLTVFPDPDDERGFRVHSFAGDDPIVCRDYVAEKLGLPRWESNKPKLERWGRIMHAMSNHGGPYRFNDAAPHG